MKGLPPRLRFGLGIRRGTVEHVLRQGRLAAEAGFDTIWYMDHLLGFPVERHVLEPFSIMGALSQITQGVPLGIVATDPYRRSAPVLAQTLGTLGLLTGKPMSLALGSGEAMNLRPYGLPEDRPLARLRELFPAIRGMLAATPERRHSQPGEFAALDEAYLQLPGAPMPRLYLAGNGPRNRQIAGALADGWIPLLLSPELYERDLAEILAHREAAGLEAATFDPGYQLDFAYAPTADAGRAMLAKTVKSLLHAFPKKAARFGIEVTAEYDWHDLVPRPGTQAAMETHYAGIDDGIVDRTSIFGDHAQCLAGIRRFYDAGCRHLIVRSANPIEEVCAFFRERVFPVYRGAAPA